MEASVCSMPAYLLIVCVLLMWLNWPKNSDENDDDDDQLLIESSWYPMTLKYFNVIISFILLLILRIFELF